MRGTKLQSTDQTAYKRAIYHQKTTFAMHERTSLKIDRQLV